MDRLRSWWRWWQGSEAENDRRMGRDERYRQIEADAWRIASRTIPVTVLLALVAGRLWLPETIERTAALQLAALAGLVIMGVFLLAVKIIKDRRGAVLTDPAIPPYLALIQYIASALGVVLLILLSDWLLGMSINWAAVAGVLTGLAMWPLVNSVRWRREQGRISESG